MKRLEGRWIIDCIKKGEKLKVLDKRLYKRERRKLKGLGIQLEEFVWESRKR